MGIWARHVTPRLIEATARDTRALPYRERACTGLHGHVVELGFGSGMNVPLYPCAVSEVTAVEPSDVAWALAAKRLAASTVPVRRGGLDGQRLDLPDASADCVLSTFTLCTIPDPGRALEEVRRVLRPGGTFHFLEHGIAPEQDVQRWQRRLEPLQRRVFDGCHLTRRIDELVRASGLSIEALDAAYAELPSPRAFRFTYLGRARAV